MGSRGPAPAPTALRLIRGDRPERVNLDEPIPVEQEIVRPDWLHPAGRELWDQLAADLAAKGVLTHWDVPALAAACEWWALYRQATTAVWKQGMLIPGTRGTKVKNPNVEVARSAFDAAMKLFARFGLTPADRAQLRLTPQRRGSGADRFFT